MLHPQQFFYTPVQDGTYYGITRGRRVGGQRCHSLSRAYLQDYASYGYEIPWMDRSHQGRVQCTGIITLACVIFSTTGHRPASLCYGQLSVVHASIRLCVNFFLKHLLL